MKLTRQDTRRDTQLGTMKDVETRRLIGELKGIMVLARHFKFTRSPVPKPTNWHHHNVRNTPASKPGPKRHRWHLRSTPRHIRNLHYLLSRLHHQPPPALRCHVTRPAAYR